MKTKGSAAMTKMINAINEFRKKDGSPIAESIGELTEEDFLDVATIKSITKVDLVHLFMQSEKQEIVELRQHVKELEKAISVIKKSSKEEKRDDLETLFVSGVLKGILLQHTIKKSMCDAVNMMKAETTEDDADE